MRLVGATGQVLAAAAAFGPELVLLDSSLEHGDALALLDQLRRRCPVIVMTEFRDDATPAAAIGRGAVARIGKPFKPAVLARVVADTLS